MAKTPKILRDHARRRAEERYGMELNKQAVRDIVQTIRTNQATFVDRTSNNRTLWQVPYQQEVLNVVYDHRRATLCTVLPKDAEEFKPQEPMQKVSERKNAWRKDVTAELSSLWGDEEG